MWNSQTSRSPPPLHHPIPTHPHYIPEPPDTPVGSEPSGYMRFSSESTRPPIDSFTNPPVNANPGFVPRHGHSPQPGGTAGYTNAPSYGIYPQPPNVYNNQGVAGGPNAMGAGAVPAFGGAPWGNMGINDATAQMGMQLGRTAVQAGQEYVEKNFGSFWLPMRTIKGSFNVSNGYVVKKLGLLVLPWRHRGWNRRVLGGEGEGNAPRYAPPRDDVNSPDLYIPSMAIVTYILLSALRAGLDAKFHPEVLARKMSTAITIIILECVFVKLGCYALGVPNNAGNGQMTDILAYTGYKFVACTVLLLLTILKCKTSIYWGIFLYLFAANGFFLVSLSVVVKK
ncbi:hypothetical protein M408DRAFT_234514 [Serendipita vermifera MAFF 305830]|uniref:Protein YIF1 n=1 Tax=Serendipita vermifera MAFF 305830 TaxID=933852 RepID=A0A0C3AWF3_SERVB|nr:hypothetical protein M408DRAFT_234514 [Serendipita vermifera MAFF 305830]